MTVQTPSSPTPSHPHSPAPRLARLLIVDDETELMTALCEATVKQGYEAAGFTSGKEALGALKEQEFDLLLTDLMMPEMDGIALLRAALEIDPHLVGVVMTGQGTIQTAVEAMKVGAFDYVLKPFKLREVLPVLSRALEVRRLRVENMQLRETVAIHELSAAIAFTLDLSTILNKLADAALQQCQADEVSVMLPIRETDELYVVVARGGEQERLLGERIPIAQGIAGWVARHGEPLTLHGEVTDPRFAPVRPRPDIHASISMPMMVGGKLVGVLNVNATRPRRSLTLGQVKALQILTSTAAAALESAWLFTQVQEAEEKYRSIFENAVEGIFQTAPDGRILTVNLALAHMHGYESPEELIATVPNVEQLYVFPEHRKEIREFLEKHGVVRGLETQVCRKDGITLWASLSVRAVRDASGALLSYDGTVEDVTERKRAEEALREAQDRLNHVVSSSPAVTYALRVQGNALLPTWVSANMPQMTGYEAQETLTFAWWRDHLHPEERERVLAELSALFTHGHLVHEYRFRRKDETYFWIREESRTLRDASGQPVEVIGSWSDITEWKKLEQQLIQAQKMEAVGTLAGGIAHDFNNVLTGIIGFAQLALMEPEGGDGWREFVARIPNQGQQAARLIAQLLTFSRKAVVEKFPMSLLTLAKETVKMLEHTLPENIAIRLNVPGPITPVNADLTQMQQVIMNLCVNAGHAMPDGGELTISLQNVTLDEEYCRQYAYARPGDYLCLSVRDTGVGMTPEVQAHIFEPFFTTKRVGEGTGLGLATVYGIVKEHGGHVNVYSEVGKGSEFKVYLPALKDETTPQTTSAKELPERGTETLLMVEDKDVVLTAGKTMLERLGYTVLTARDGREALDVYLAHQHEIALVVTDVMMPEMGGLELYEALWEINPEVKVVLMSGYSLKQEVTGPRASGVKGYVQKPFDVLTLSRAVRRALMRVCASKGQG